MSSAEPVRPAGRSDVHSFVELHEGRCHYRLTGPVTGATILLVHGATVPGWEFDLLVPFLHAAGWRTLCPDLYGHGYSDRPRTRYSHALFVRQLLDLLDALDVQAEVRLLGHSLGAALAARLIAAQPARFHSALLGAPLVDYMANVPATRLLKWPVLGECLVPAYVLPMLRRRRRRNYALIEDGRFVGQFMRQLELPGFGRALLSMFRQGALGAQRDAYLALARLGHPVRVLHGALDVVVTPAQLDALRTWLPAAGYSAIEHAAHAFMLTHPSIVARHALDFFAPPETRVHVAELAVATPT